MNMPGAAAPGKLPGKMGLGLVLVYAKVRWCTTSVDPILNVHYPNSLG